MWASAWAYATRGGTGCAAPRDAGPDLAVAAPQPRAADPSPLLVMAPARCRDLLDRLLGPAVVAFAHDVGLGDDAHDQAVVVHHRDAAHLLAPHQLHHVLDVVVGADRLRVAGHRVAHRRVRPPLGDDADGDVAIGHEADEALRDRGLDHRQDADVLLLHEACGLLDRRVRRDRGRVL